MKLTANSYNVTIIWQNWDNYPFKSTLYTFVLVQTFDFKHSYIQIKRSFPECILHVINRFGLNYQFVAIILCTLDNLHATHDYGNLINY